MGRAHYPTRGALLLALLAAFAAIGLSTRLNTKNAVSSREAAIEVARPTGKLLHETEKSKAALQRARIADGEWDDDSDDEELGMSDVDFLMLGISKKGADPEDDPDYVDDKFCHKNRYRKRTFKVVKEMPFAGLFPTLQRTRRFEGSGIAYANGSYFVVFDSLKTLGRVDLRFSFRGPENRLVGPVGDESQFEGISYNAPSDSFFVLRESFEHEEHGLVPVVYELKLTEEGANYRLMETCMVRFQLQDVNKGFESLHVFERDGKRHMLGLCESNFCKTIIGPDPPGLQRGNGRLVWATYRAPEDQYDECIWNVEKVIVLPEDAFLLDYAAIAFHGDFGEDVAIVSQEDAAVWVGKFDWTEMEFVKNPIPGEPAGQIYHFPRTDDCHKQYCNVEGAAWIDAERLVLTSDKSKRIQDHRCMTKDQSVHIMSLP